VLVSLEQAGTFAGCQGEHHGRAIYAGLRWTAGRDLNDWIAIGRLDGHNNTRANVNVCSKTQFPLIAREKPRQTPGHSQQAKLLLDP
jgi:hypothetical protein